MKRTSRSFCSGSRGLGIALCLMISRSAPAQESLPLDNFKPAASSRRYYVTEDGAVLGHLQPSVELWGNYAKSPLQLVDTRTNDAAADLVRYRWDVDLLIAIGFFDRLELGVVLPATVAQAGERLDGLDRTSELGGGFRDVRVIPKVLVARDSAKVLHFGLALPFSLPTGKSGDFLGAGTATFSPHAILSFDTGRLDLATNAGFRLRKGQDIGFSESQPRVAMGSEVFGSLGLKFALVKERLDLVGDVFTAVSVEEQDREEVPMESLGGLRVYFKNGVVLNAGGGAGLTRGIGTPAYRVLAGIGYTYQEDPDRDRDGVLNEADRCPDQPEDMDDFEDADGCPESDNDRDGRLDAADRCPLEPEDMDRFEDADGCPDPDNDADGLIDDQDRCPSQAEDRDAFEDADGCPDPDNDADTVLDDQDKCPLQPEDKDNFEDADGCLDADNDSDGILDVSDQCPLEPETVNSNEDEDGCPDRAKGPVQIEHGKVTTPPVFFASNKDVILEQSFPILAQVAEAFLSNPWVKRVRIEGHTDDRGSDSFNLKLSQARADSVKRFLVGRGVDPERLETVGYGETQPLVSNASGEGRAQNRRVAFIILEPSESQTDAP